jgi:ABC-type amino acid transport substrate-binding protein
VVTEVTVADEEAVAGAAGVIGTAGCPTVAWTGFDPFASALFDALGTQGLGDVRLVGTDAMKDERFLTETERGADGTVAVCPCVDLTTSTRIEAQRFVHDFQSASGSPPGVYAVEGWDVAGMLVDTIRSGAVDRAAVGDAIRSRGSYEGLAGPYAFRSDGELERGASRTVAYRAEGLRWLPVAGDPEAVALPVRTRGYLALGSCRTGRPFRYRREGRLTGFEVEVANRIAARLELVPIWSELRCPQALRALETGRLDAVVAPPNDLRVGTPTSRVVLALDGALVVTGPAPPGSDPAGGLDAGSTVAVVDDPVVRSWAGGALGDVGARLVVLPRGRAYDRLARGGVDAVADLEYAAWAATEHRPEHWVVGGHPTGATDVIAGSVADAEVLAAIDQALERMISSGRYALLFGAWFPGTPIPAAVGGSVDGG